MVICCIHNVSLKKVSDSDNTQFYIVPFDYFEIFFKNISNFQ